MKQSDDLMYNILLHIDSMKHLCLTNTTSSKICKNIYLWENKFKQYNLPLLIEPKSINKWIS